MSDANATIYCKLCNRETQDYMARVCDLCIMLMFIDGTTSMYDVGKLLGLKTLTIRRLEDTNKLVPTIDARGSRRYSFDAVVAYLKSKGEKHFVSNINILDDIGKAIEAEESYDIASYINESPQENNLKWSAHFQKCRLCKTTITEHYGGGYCTNCYPRTNESKILEGYIQGENLSEIGVRLGFSRERARQLFNKAIDIEVDRLGVGANQTAKQDMQNEMKIQYKQNRASHKYRHVIEQNYDKIVNILSTEMVLSEVGIIKTIGVAPSAIYLIRDQYPEFLDMIAQNKKRWSWKYDVCKKCGMTENKHKRWGYCEKCYTSTDEWRAMQTKYRSTHMDEIRTRNRIYGATYIKRPEVVEKSKQKAYKKHFDGNRDAAFVRFGHDCHDCHISRVDFKEKTGKDIPVYHIDGNRHNNSPLNLMPLCFSCLAKRKTANKPINNIVEVKKPAPKPVVKLPTIKEQIDSVQAQNLPLVFMYQPVNPNRSSIRKTFNDYIVVGNKLIHIHNDGMYEYNINQITEIIQ